MHIDGMDKGQAIKHLWLNEREKFRRYSIGDVHDLLVIFREIISK